MKGEKVKEILRSEGFKLSEVAELLGFDNDQRLHSALRSEDVKTGLLEDIARVTNKSICVFFGTVSDCSADSSDHSVAVAGSNNSVDSTNQTTYGDNSPAVKGNNNHFGGCASVDKAFADIDKALSSIDRSFDEAASQRLLTERTLALLEKRDAQIDRLIDLLQTQISKQ